jgi:hypothetical protein
MGRFIPGNSPSPVRENNDVVWQIHCQSARLFENDMDVAASS